MAIGLEVASQANRSDGETSPVAVLSVPTGQFAAWLIAAGALGAAPKLRPIEQTGVFCCTTWDADSGQIADRVVSVFTSDGKLVHKVGRTSYTRGLPVVRHHIPPPEVRARHRTFTKAEVARIRKVIQPMMPRTENWYIWWTRQCLSPVVIVGDGGEYLLKQKNEVLTKQPNWFWDTSRTLLSLEDRKSTRLNSSHVSESRMPSSA